MSLKNLMRWSWTSTLSCNRWPPSTLWLLKSSKSKRKLIRQWQKFKKRQVKFLKNWKKLREPLPNMPRSNNWPKSKSRYLMLMRLNNSSASSKLQSGTWRSYIRRTLSHLIIKWVNLKSRWSRLSQTSYHWFKWNRMRGNLRLTPSFLRLLNMPS